MSTLPVCPACQKPAPMEGVAFCPFCGAPYAREKELDANVRKCLDAVAKQSDPKKKHELLMRAQAEHPDCLEIEEQLLYLGRLYERDPRKMDYSVIKCYLLQMYLEPEEFSETKRDEMRRELFHHPQFERCMALAPDASVFERRYLETLCREFIRIFLRGSNRYMQSIFGVRFDNRAPKLLAAPTAKMLNAIRKDFDIGADERSMLSGALYAAFEKEMGGETRYLTELLDAPGVSEEG